jgi:flavodoxin
MKLIKIITIILIIVMITILFVGCDEAEINPSANNSTEQNFTPINTEQNILVVYFSRSGNTEKLANIITEAITADVFVIDPVEPYTDTYEATLATAGRERAENARPEYIGAVENMENYDIIVLGYPIWGGTLPMIVHTFLENYDLSGKTIYPFWSSNHGGYFNTIDVIETALPNSIIGEGFSIRGGEVSEAQESIRNWLLNIGLMED